MLYVSNESFMRRSEVKLDVFCEVATHNYRLSVMHYKSTKHFIWFI